MAHVEAFADSARLDATKRKPPPVRPTAMLAALGVSLLLLRPHSAPKYTLDLRDAPTSAMFAMMLGGRETYVTRGFPPFVTLRLTADQIAFPESPVQIGDFLPLVGWLAYLDREKGFHGLVVGLEREGGVFHVDGRATPREAASDAYLQYASPWHRVRSVGDGGPVPSPTDIGLAGIRLAGVWLESVKSRKAIVVARASSGEEFTRFVQEGEPLGIGGLKVETVEATAIVLSGSPVERFRLELRGEPRSVKPTNSQARKGLAQIG